MLDQKLIQDSTKKSKYLSRGIQSLVMEVMFMECAPRRHNHSKEEHWPPLQCFPRCDILTWGVSVLFTISPTGRTSSLQLRSWAYRSSKVRACNLSIYLLVKRIRPLVVSNWDNAKANELRMFRGNRQQVHGSAYGDSVRRSMQLYPGTWRWVVQQPGRGQYSGQP